MILQNSILRFIISVLLYSFFAASFYGCASTGNKGGTSSGGSIAIPTIPPATVSNKPLGVSFKPYVMLEAIKDQRQYPELARVNGTTLEPRGSIDLVTQYAFRSTFRKRGFTVTDNAPVVLSPSVKKWMVTVSADQGLAEAVIALDVLDPSNEIIYSSTYDGFLQFPPTNSNDEIAKILGTVFSKALSSMIADEHLLEILTAF